MVFSQEDWGRFLTRELDQTVRVRFGRARRNVIVARPENWGFTIRMNGVFGTAPPEVREAVAKWLRSGRRARRACERLDTWIAEVTKGLAPARRTRVRTRGEVHDLAEIHAELLRDEFAETTFPEPAPTVTYGKRSSGRVRRSLQLGSYDPETGVVRLHPVLDQGNVPRWFVRYVLFHELLHAALGSDCERGDRKRTSHHGPRFRELERAYCDYARAIAWQDEHLSRLLASARTGKPLARKRPRLERLVQRLLF